MAATAPAAATAAASTSTSDLKLGFDSNKKLDTEDSKIKTETAKARTVKVSKDIPGLSFTSSSGKIDDSKINTDMSKVLQLIQAHPAAQTLLQQVLKAGAVTVEFCPIENIRASAQWNPIYRRIRIADCYPDIADLLDSFVFELCNANNNDDIDYNKTEKDHYPSYLQKTPTDETLKKHAEEFATRAEKFERFSHNRAAKLQQEGIAKYGWQKPRLLELRTETSEAQWLIQEKIPSMSHAGLSHFDNYVKKYYESTLLQIQSTIDTDSELNTLDNTPLQTFVAIEKQLNEEKTILEEKMKLLLEMKKAEEASKTMFERSLESMEDVHSSLLRLKKIETEVHDASTKIKEGTEQNTDQLKKYEEDIEETKRKINANPAAIKKIDDEIKALAEKINQLETKRKDAEEKVKAYRKTISEREIRLRNAQACKVLVEGLLEALNLEAKLAGPGLITDAKIREASALYSEELKLYVDLQYQPDSTYRDLCAHDSTLSKLKTKRMEIIPFLAEGENVFAKLMGELNAEYDELISQGQQFKKELKNFHAQTQEMNCCFRRFTCCYKPIIRENKLAEIKVKPVAKNSAAAPKN